MDIKWTSARQQFSPGKELKPKIDPVVSKIVGKKVLVLDPRLLSLVVKWKRESGNTADSDKQDDFFKQPAKIEELKQVFQNG